MVSMESAIFTGTVMHHRFRPKKHRFTYQVFSCCFDLDELPWLDSFKLLSVNRFNLFSFHEKDHGAGNRNLAGHIRRLLHKRGFANATHRIKLLCYPRILGYSFNPLSVYFCYDNEERLQVILYEVSNTFGSRHTYLLPTENQTEIVRHGCEKLMYVSPFMPMETAYSFRIQPPSDKIAVCIRQSDKSTQPLATSPLLHATFTGNKILLNDLSLWKMFFRYPLMTLKVMGGIHWEALKLWRKKLSIQPRKKEKTFTISWQDQSGELRYENL